MSHPAAHEVLAAVLQIRDGALQVLAWQRARPPDSGRWALPGGWLRDDEDVEQSVLRQLAEKVDVREVAHVEQISVFSRPDRVPAIRTVATAFLGLVPSDADPAVPADTAWHPLAALPPTAFDHAMIVRAARDRLRAKLSYTNLGFALAPASSRSPRCASCTPPRSGTRCRPPTCSACSPAAVVLEPTGRVAPPGSGRRPPGRGVPVHGSHRCASPTRSPCSSRRASTPGRRTVATWPRRSRCSPWARC